MRKIIITSLGIFLAYILMYSCRKSDIKGDSSNLVLGSYVTLDSVVNANLDVANAASAVSIKVDKAVGEPVASINIYAATASGVEDVTGWKLIKNVPYSDGVVLSVTTAELQAAFGATPLAPGNIYTLQNEVVTKSGRKFSVANTPDTYNSFPAYNMALSWKATAVCAFVQSESAGTYKVVTDKWVDYNPGDIITVSAGPGPNQLNALIYPSVIIGGGTGQVNTIIDVNPATGVATVAKQQTGYYGSASPGNLVTVSGTGFVFSCTGLISLTFTVNVGGTDYKNQTFSMQHL
jgi:hypothetical protein